MDDFYCVVTFDVTQHALIFEKTLRENGLSVKLMPAPRQVSTSCGTAAIISCADEMNIKTLCDEENISFENFHKVKNEKKSNWFSKHIKK